ncbi:hypothetical protein CK516_21255 [Nostoc sp. 'Peltigera malacea cyanobiont' DB3992]|nr:hypothetical protein CK516_21255 [Nostoc sp. 'Peltigera malacea cyanobiont' DB3992]
MLGHTQMLEISNAILTGVKAEVATKKVEVLAGKAEVATDCAKHRNVKSGSSCRESGSCYRLRETPKRQPWSNIF